MVVKKKGLCLGLLLLLGIGNVIQAYTVKILNSTPYTIKYKVDLIACSDDSGELASGHTATHKTGLCMVRAVEATVYEAPTTLDPTLARRQTRRVKARRYYARAGRAGSTNFIVTGPFGFGEKTQYRVTREVN